MVILLERRKSSKRRPSTQNMIIYVASVVRKVIGVQHVLKKEKKVVQVEVAKAVKGGKRDVDCNKQIEKAVTTPNCVLKGLWGEGGSGVSERN